MNHIDEGTIHAWLDGALDASRSREIEAHVAQCQPCAAAVAEARGLVAASSRILSALDDVPSGIVPKRAVAPRRQWRAAPWVTGIAAAMMLGIGLTQWRRDDVATGSDFATTSELLIARAPLNDSAVAPAAFSAGAASPAVLAPTIPSRSTARLNTASRPPAQRRATIASAERSEQAARGAGSLSASANQKAVAGAVADNALVMGAKPEAPDVAGLAGCYRAAGAPAPSGATSARAPERTRASVARAVAPAPAAAVAFAPRMPDLIQLDTVPQSPGYVVRDLDAGAPIGWWSRAGGDSIRVELSSRGSLMLSATARVSCPK